MSKSAQLTQHQARNICQLQTRFNQGLDENWPLTPVIKRDDVLAAIEELVEYRCHQDYHWWKNGIVNEAQANMELIDVLHFAISDVIELHAIDKAEDPVEEAYHDLHVASCARSLDATDVKWLIRDLALEGRPEIDRPLAFGESALARLMSLLLNAYGSGDAVYAAYLTKNALNHTRKSRGYREGTYIKSWDGEEDNEVAVRLLSDNEAVLMSEQPLDDAIVVLQEYYDTHIAA